MRKEVIKSYGDYNASRYSAPWICKMTEDGKFDFSKEVGIYTGSRGSGGDIVVFDPVDGQVYGCGQKDYKGRHTEVGCVIWDGTEFKPCDKLGTIKK